MNHTSARFCALMCMCCSKNERDSSPLKINFCVPAEEKRHTGLKRTKLWQNFHFRVKLLLIFHLFTKLLTLCGFARMLEPCKCEKGPCYYLQRSMVGCFIIKMSYVIVLSIFFCYCVPQQKTTTNYNKNNSLWIMWLLHLRIFYVNISTSEIQENK